MSGSIRPSPHKGAIEQLRMAPPAHGLVVDLDVHVRRLRMKLGLGDPHEAPIVAVRGFGYKAAPGVPAQALAPD